MFLMPMISGSPMYDTQLLDSMLYSQSLPPDATSTIVSSTLKARLSMGLSVEMPFEAQDRSPAFQTRIAPELSPLTMYLSFEDHKSWVTTAEPTRDKGVNASGDFVKTNIEPSARPTTTLRCGVCR